MKRKLDIRKEAFSVVYDGLEYISNECHNHKHCKRCDLYVEGDCMLNKPPEHWALGEILMHLFGPNNQTEDKECKFEIKE